jgi:hypothetical protein
MCGLDGSKDNSLLDSHHITDRNFMPSGGYVKENGITLCVDNCHLKAEEYLQGTVKHEGFSPEDLYRKINSNYELAKKASLRL